jgi:hypothetical protein
MREGTVYELIRSLEADLDFINLLGRVTLLGLSLLEKEETEGTPSQFPSDRTC